MWRLDKSKEATDSCAMRCRRQQDIVRRQPPRLSRCCCLHHNLSSNGVHAVVQTPESDSLQRRVLHLVGGAVRHSKRVEVGHLARPSGTQRCLFQHAACVALLTHRVFCGGGVVGGLDRAERCTGLRGPAHHHDRQLDWLPIHRVRGHRAIFRALISDMMGSVCEWLPVCRYRIVPQGSFSKITKIGDERKMHEL